ncbi:peptidoglycan DD-metalloendopeptidase family protein [bacterium]|nr:peptidoglycan DD-metalloendopeptidase family protein [bacterium]
MRKFAPLALLLLIVGCGGGSRPARTVPQGSADARPSGSGRTIVHIVEPGQTLWSIARRYGVEVGEIVRANGINNPDQLAVGTRLRIAGATSGPHTAQDAVRAGDWHWPIRGGTILSSFGEPRRTHKHQGVDIRGLHGEPVIAAEAGRVVYSDATMRGYGKTVILDHGKGLRTLYAHNSALLVRPGDQVRKGQRIAKVGRTGNATTEHVHFEIRLHEVPVNPMDYFTTRIAETEVGR